MPTLSPDGHVTLEHHSIERRANLVARQRLSRRHGQRLDRRGRIAERDQPLGRHGLRQRRFLEVALRGEILLFRGNLLLPQRFFTRSRHARECRVVRGHEVHTPGVRQLTAVHDGHHVTALHHVADLRGH